MREKWAEASALKLKSSQSSCWDERFKYVREEREQVRLKFSFLLCSVFLLTREFSLSQTGFLRSLFHRPEWKKNNIWTQGGSTSTEKAEEGWTQTLILPRHPRRPQGFVWARTLNTGGGRKLLLVQTRLKHSQCWKTRNVHGALARSIGVDVSGDSGNRSCYPAVKTWKLSGHVPDFPVYHKSVWLFSFSLILTGKQWKEKNVMFGSLFAAKINWRCAARRSDQRRQFGWISRPHPLKTGFCCETQPAGRWC